MPKNMVPEVQRGLIAFDGPGMSLVDGPAIPSPVQKTRVRSRWLIALGPGLGRAAAPAGTAGLLLQPVGWVGSSGLERADVIDQVQLRGRRSGLAEHAVHLAAVVGLVVE